MIVDFRALPPDTAIDADICIVGAGPTGLALAREFFGSTTTVVALESGGLTYEAASEALNLGESIGLRHAGLTQGRRRQFAGAANIWGAVCVELDASDLAHRPWIPDSGWPISLADVAPFYRRARTMFKLDRTDMRESEWRAFGMQTAEFDPTQLRFTIAATTPATDLGKVYRNDFARSTNVTVVLHAIVTSLKTNVDGTALDRVEFRSLDGKAASVRARAFVLCCGGIENARLLLMSRDTQPNGLGNGHDLVGRYLADHTFSLSARVMSRRGKALAPHFRGLRRRKSNLRPRLSLPPDQQARAGVLNCMAQIHFEHPSDGGYAAALNLRKAARFRRMPKRLGRDVATVLRHPRELMQFAVDRYVRGLHPADGRATAWLECMAEQLPNRDSRVTLSDRRDHIGSPLPVVDWRTHECERRTIAFMTETVSREFRRLGLGEIQTEEWLHTPGPSWQSHLVEGFHHMGTTRMAASPRSGVVDADGNVHGIAGLYVAGTSVFPAAGYANPTLTIVALAIRLADHLKRRLRSPLGPIHGAASIAHTHPSLQPPTSAR